MTIYNFSAGPATMPDPVIAQIKQDLPSYNDSGMSVMEISHRSELFEDIHRSSRKRSQRIAGDPR